MTIIFSSGDRLTLLSERFMRVRIKVYRCRRPRTDIDAVQPGDILHSKPLNIGNNSHIKSRLLIRKYLLFTIKVANIFFER